MALDLGDPSTWLRKTCNLATSYCHGLFLMQLFDVCGKASKAVKKHPSFSNQMGCHSSLARWSLHSRWLRKVAQIVQSRWLVCSMTHHDAAWCIPVQWTVTHHQDCITRFSSKLRSPLRRVYDKVSFDLPFCHLRRITLHHAAARRLAPNPRMIFCSIAFTFQRLRSLDIYYSTTVSSSSKKWLSSAQRTLLERISCVCDCWFDTSLQVVHFSSSKPAIVHGELSFSWKPPCLENRIEASFEIAMAG